MAAFTRGLPLGSIVVGDVMSKVLRTVRPEEDIAAASAAMRELRLRRLPVVNSLGRLVGLVTLGDLARKTSQGKFSAAKGIDQEGVAETLAAVSLPWSAVQPSATQDRGLLRPQPAG